MSQNDSGREGFFTGLILQMAKEIGWPALKALVAKLEAGRPNIAAAPRPLKIDPLPSVRGENDSEPAEPPDPPPAPRRGWGKRA